MVATNVRAMLKHPTFEATMSEMMDWIRAQPTADLKADAARHVQDLLLEYTKVVRTERSSAYRIMAAQGYSYREIAERAGLSAQRVEQLVNG